MPNPFGWRCTKPSCARKVSVESVVVGIGGSVGRRATAAASMNSAGRREVEPATTGATPWSAAAHVRLEEDRMILHLLPQDFTLDGRAGYRNPHKAASARAWKPTSTCHRVRAGAPGAGLRAVHQAHLAVEETMFEPVAAAYACGHPEDRARGVAVVDIGTHSTDLVVYDGEALLLAAQLCRFGAIISRATSPWLLKVNYEDAERLKQRIRLRAAGPHRPITACIEVPSAEGRGLREAPRKQLNEILEARAEELFLYVSDRSCCASGMEQNLLEGVILTGGGAMLNGMCDMAERSVELPGAQRIWRQAFEDWPEELDESGCGPRRRAWRCTRRRLKMQSRRPSAALGRYLPDVLR